LHTLVMPVALTALAFVVRPSVYPFAPWTKGVAQ
jgi:hypothetical protein